jgi:hypothetical protein
MRRKLRPFSSAAATSREGRRSLRQAKVSKKGTTAATFYDEMRLKPVMGCPAMTLTEADKKCFKLAIEMVRKRGGGDQQQIEKVLSARGFESAGHFACYSCQVDVLGVRPWQPVPSCAFIREGWQDFIARGDDATLGKYAASVLLRQMLGLGISPYHPDPKGAIAEAEAANKRRPKSREPV